MQCKGGKAKGVPEDWTGNSGFNTFSGSSLFFFYYSWRYLLSHGSSCPKRPMRTQNKSAVNYSHYGALQSKLCRGRHQSKLQTMA